MSKEKFPTNQEFANAFVENKTRYTDLMEEAIRWSSDILDAVGLSFNQLHQITPLNLPGGFVLNTFPGNLKGAYYSERIVNVDPGGWPDNMEFEFIEFENYGPLVYIPLNADAKRAVFNALQDFKAGE